MPHVIVEGGFPALVGMLNILAGQFQHADHWQSLVQPDGDLGLKHRDSAEPLTALGLFLYLFAQDSRDRITMVPRKLGNLDIAPAFVFQVVNR